LKFLLQGEVVQPIAIIDRGRGPELAGTRITVFDVLPYLQADWQPASIALLLGLSTSQVLAVMEYVEEHWEAVMATNQKILDRIARGNPPEVEAKRQASRAKLQALRAELERQRSQETVNARDPG
jgi:uncharacterized protein (DUF433 family)